MTQPPHPRWLPALEPEPAVPADAVIDGLGPLVLDERVNPPTPTEQQGLEASIIGTLWNDPIALLGSQRGVIDWTRPAARGASGTYIPPGWPARGSQHFAEPPAGGEPGHQPDTIRFPMGQPSLWPGDTGQYVVSPRVAFSTHPTGATARTMPVATYEGAGTEPGFPSVGRHEFRHRGFYHLPGLARAYGVPFDPNARPMAGTGFEPGERLNVLQDRRLGDMESYPDMQYSPEQERYYGAMLDHLRSVADEINARRVQRMINIGGRWSDQP